MKKLLSLALTILVCAVSMGQTWTQRNISIAPNSPAFYEYLPVGYNDPINAGKKYPTIIYFHGMGENSGVPNLNYLLVNDMPKLIQNGQFPTSFTMGLTNYSFIVICPQVSWSGFIENTTDMVTYVEANYRVDPTRLYLTGLSQGGEMALKYVANDTGRAKKIAAVAVAAPSWWPNTGPAQTMASKNVPLWFFHNDADPVVNVFVSNGWVTEVNNFSPTPLAQKTILASSSHDSWSAMYDPSRNVTGGLNIYKWFLQYSRPENAVSSVYKIVVMGSSTAFGTGASPIDSSYVSRLNAFYNQDEADMADTVIYNIAVGALTTYEARENGFNPPGGRPTPNINNNITKALTYDPDLIIFHFPSNDVANGYTTTETMDNLRTLKVIAQANNVSSLFLSTQPRNTVSVGQQNQLKEQKDSILAAFPSNAINIYDTLAALDGLTIEASVSSGDGTHVNNAGHRRIFTKILNAPQPPVVVSNYVIPIKQGNVFTLAGYNNVDGYRWFDGNPSTKFVKVDWTADWRAGDLYPNDIWVVLDSTYNITSYDVNTNYETGLSYSLFFYDANKNQIGDSTAFNSLANGWRNFSLVKNNVRFVRLKTYSTFASNTGLRDVVLNGLAISIAPSIWPTPGTNSYVDVGEKAHGMNYLGDRFDKLDLQNDTIVTKITKSVRWYETGTDFDYYPDTYYGRLINGPLWVGRYYYSYVQEHLTAKLRRRGLSPMFSKTGGTIKSVALADTNSIKNNNTWLGNVSPTGTTRYTEPGANPEIDTSWAPLAEQFYRLITLYGNNPNAVQSGTVLGVPVDKPSWGYKGQGTVDIFETGNEESRWWVQSYYHTPKAYYEQNKAVYNRGKQADPTMPIYAAALPGFDTTYWRGVWWHHYWSGGDVNNYPADGFNFNMYLNNLKGPQGYTGADTWGISPEKWQVREDMIELKAFFNRMFPGKQVQWTEFGYATDDVSPYDVNPIGSKTDRQVQAEWTMRLKALVQSTPFISRMYYYAFFEDATGPFNSMAAARDSNDWIHVIPQPVGYALGQELAIEKNYNWYSTVVVNGDSTGTWVTVKNHVSDPNKRLYKIWKGTDNNSSNSYTLNLPGAVSAIRHNLTYSTFLPVSTAQQLVSGNATFTASEAMTWMEVTFSNGNFPPVVNAGVDQVTALPFNSVTLNGSASDVDGTIASVSWAKISGPASFNLATPTQNSTVAGILTEGIYVFRFTAVDNAGATTSDDVTVVVNAEPTGSNNTPIVNAGPDLVITLPTNTVILSAVAADVDGTIASYVWTKQSGPASFSFSASNSESTQVFNLTQGIYVFRVFITDNQGASTFDEIQVTVNPAPTTGFPTVTVRSVATSKNSCTLTATASDPGGSITGYAWTQLSGPASATIVSPSSATTVINGLTVNGNYQFRVTVTDNDGNTSFANATVKKTNKYVLIRRL